MKKNHNGYTVLPFPRMRRFAIDAGHLGRKRHTVHGLLELDVTAARQHIREHKARTGETLSFTAFIITCLAQAVDENKEVHAYRNWRNQLVIFDDVNVNTMIETESGGRKVPIPHIIQAANRRTWREIHQEIRETQQRPARSKEAQFMRWFLWLPGGVRRLFYGVLTKNPHLIRGYMSSVLVTAVGMFGKGGGWGIPLANFPLTVTLGGIAEKPGVVEGRIEVREYLHVTLSFDHDIIDGAPATRFAQRFRELVEGQALGYVNLESA
jgi:pyruvate/2-oxoglutarate dehydrogenase complex dihydrolipoamide acyltransferase (E2) component